ncbi:DivIVA domain-containing protein [Spiroplasma apis]|uniref:DivIVA domain-containing protein n=1 Tax=Spiroplasma apis B31 TaxID=1276258 RepID=V5RK31_SPIAP|nr:DivIVA domain-containing protein [Spiroplasma apis]AHB36155.1 DivIVA domain-containing protein [Spiroplasma apis B31]
MANIIKLTRTDILQKDFEVEYKGYKVEEVDAFLDIIAEDYKLFADREQKQEKKIKDLTDKIARLKSDLSSTMAHLKLNEQQKEELARQGLGSSALIERISNLEKGKFNKE